MEAVNVRKQWPRRAPGARGSGVAFVAVVLVACVIGAPVAVAQTESHARISFESGNGMVKGSADADWSFATVNTLVLPGDTLWVDKTGMMELETSGGTFVRLADGSKADVTSLPPSGAIRGWVGSFYVQRIRRSTGDMVFSTPMGDVSIDPGSDVRVDIGDNGATTVSVRWGRATVTAPGGPGVDLGEGQRSYTDPGYLPSEPTPFDKSVEDAFDSWNRDRTQSLAVGEEAIPKSVVQESVPAGAADLAAYGEWIDVDNRPCWHPLVADYVPYRYGHWSFVPAYGYCWIDDYPFAYVTSHHGRWFHHEHHGWVWTYGETWGPAWVASFHYGPNFVWCPLDPFDHPVAYSGEFFDVGGVHVGIYASSFCPADGLLLYGGPTVMCRPLTPVIIRESRHMEVNVWNINVHPQEHYRHMYDGFRVPVRDFAPKRFIRGPEELRFAGANGSEGMVKARARVANLETPAMRKDFRPAAAAQSRRDVRTPVGQVPKAEARQVNIAPTAIEHVQQRARAASAATPEAKREALKTVPAPGVRQPAQESPRTATRAERAPEAAPTPAPSGKRETSVRERTTAPSERQAKPETSSPPSTSRSERSPQTSAPPRTQPPEVKRTTPAQPGVSPRERTQTAPPSSRTPSAEPTPRTRTQAPEARSTPTPRRESVPETRALPPERAPSATREKVQESRPPKAMVDPPRPQRVNQQMAPMRSEPPRVERPTMPEQVRSERVRPEAPRPQPQAQPMSRPETRSSLPESRHVDAKDRAGAGRTDDSNRNRR